MQIEMPNRIPSVTGGDYMSAVSHIEMTSDDEDDRTMTSDDDTDLTIDSDDEGGVQVTSAQLQTVPMSRLGAPDFMTMIQNTHSRLPEAAAADFRRIIKMLLRHRPAAAHFMWIIQNHPVCLPGTDDFLRIVATEAPKVLLLGRSGILDFKKTLARVKTCMRMRGVFEGYLRKLDHDVNALMIRDPGLAPIEATFKAMRRAGGHVLKDAKKLFRVLRSKYGHPQVIASPVNWGFAEVCCSYMPFGQQPDIDPRIAQRYPHLAQHMQRSDQERTFRRSTKAIVSDWSVGQTWSSHQLEIGSALIAILSKR